MRAGQGRCGLGLVQGPDDSYLGRASSRVESAVLAPRTAPRAPDPVLSALVSYGPYHRVWQVLGTDGSSELSKDLRGWDTDGSGAIGFEEFKQLMKAAVPPPPEESLAAESF